MDRFSACSATYAFCSRGLLSAVCFGCCCPETAATAEERSRAATARTTVAAGAGDAAAFFIVPAAAGRALPLACIAVVRRRMNQLGFLLAAACGLVVRVGLSSGLRLLCAE